MKRKRFIKYLEENNCVFEREGGKHTIYKNTGNGNKSTVPRHPDSKEALCRKICKDLGIKPII
jgi:predicted RNA binding protein YcfA (HicA-like mRNA interferase family)